MDHSTSEAKASSPPHGGLFDFVDKSKSIEQTHTELPPVQRAILAIERILKAAHPIRLAWSTGKDSSTCVNLAFTAAINVMKEGFTCPPLVVSHADTMVESPVVRALADGEMQKMRDFASAHAIPLEIRIGRPTLAACYVTRVIGGRALPPFPQTTRDCSVDFKIRPMQRISAQLAKENPKNGPAVVTIIGTRSDESMTRRQNTVMRKEAAHEIWYGPDGDARLSPILDWTSSDVWEYLGESAQGLHPSYSDFQQTIEFYADAGGSSCVVVADMNAVSTSKACGARSGCWACTATGSQDASVENMLASNPGRYPYLVPLLELRNFIADTQWDWSKRNFLGRTISADGSIKAAADQYSPQMVEDLLYYFLAAQARANELGAPARVTAIGIRELIAIDFFWSLRAWHPPFHALAIYFDHCAGNRRYAPKITTPCRPTPAPQIGEIHVGGDWDDDASLLYPSGLRHHNWELFSESCGPQLRTNKAGKMFLALEEAPEFDVDEEGALDFLEFIAREKIESHHDHDAPDWTLGSKTYIQYGTVTLAAGQSSAIDSMMRRAQWLQRHGLHGHQTADSVRARCSTLTRAQADLFA